MHFFSIFPILVNTIEEDKKRGYMLVLLVHFNLSLPLQERHPFQLDVDVIYAFVKEVSSPLGHLIIQIKKKNFKFTTP